MIVSKDADGNDLHVGDFVEYTDPDLKGCVGKVIIVHEELLDSLGIPMISVHTNHARYVCMQGVGMHWKLVKSKEIIEGYVPATPYDGII